MLWRTGRLLGNFNDRHLGADARAATGVVWRALDRVASHLYMTGRV